MQAATTILESPALSVVDYRCTLGPGDAPFVDAYEAGLSPFHWRASRGGEP